MAEYDHTDISHDALASGPLELWVDWLKGSVKAYYAEISVEDRVDAFAPLDVHPLSPGPAGEIARQLRKIGKAASKVAPKAVVEVLRTWSVGREGLDGALLLVELAIQLGSLNLFPALLRLLDQAADLSAGVQHDLAFLAASAAEHDCLKRTEIAGLLRRVSRMQSVSAEIIADLAVAFTLGNRDNLHRLPVDLLEILPDLADPPHKGLIADAIGRKLQLRFQIEELRLALDSHPGESLDAVLFRRELHDGVFPFEKKDDGAPPSIETATEKEFEDRIRASAPRISPTGRPAAGGDTGPHS